MGNDLGARNIDEADDLAEVHGHADLDWITGWGWLTIRKISSKDGIDIDGNTARGVSTTTGIVTR